MSTTEANSEASSSDAIDRERVGNLDMALEVVVLPVADVERAKAFYAHLGWRLDADLAAGQNFRLVQFTPPGSACSIQFGTNLTDAMPGSAEALYLVVSDIQAAREELSALGVDVSEVFHEGERGARFGRLSEGRVTGAAADHGSYRSFVAFSDPDGNGWLLQEVTTRLPGRVEPGLTSFSSAEELAGALRRAEAAHGEHEQRIGEADPNWPDWYASYMVAEKAGGELPA